ncbi:OmpA family protein [Novosphingobium tardum]|uniref:OmpA family protein n=1 Tax=Novosphingobium tardum TaxID=1538021 RepID=A0ABV8RR71_9SPHN
MRRALPASVLALAMAIAGCATDKVTLLENEPGHDTGAVAVIGKGGRETVVDRVNAQASLGSGSSHVRGLKKLKPAYGTLLGSLPPSAKAFVITFPTGSSDIPADQRGVLEQIRNELSTRPGAQIEVAGFTDSTGGDAINDKISLDRAQEVAEQLRSFGFPVDREDAIGRGEDEARARLGDEVANEGYRRVEVIVR